MHDLKNKISSWIKIILNQKRCPKCLESYSDKTTSCEVFESIKSKSTVFASLDFSPIYSRQASCNRTVWCKSTFNSIEPALYLSIKCNCGHASCLSMENQL